MRYRRDVKTKGEVLKELKMIRGKLGNLEDVKRQISDFDENDAKQSCVSGLQNY